MFCKTAQVTLCLYSLFVMGLGFECRYICYKLRLRPLVIYNNIARGFLWTLNRKRQGVPKPSKYYTKMPFSHLQSYRDLIIHCFGEKHKYFTIFGVQSAAASSGFHWLDATYPCKDFDFDLVVSRYQCIKLIFLSYERTQALSLSGKPPDEHAW